MKIKVKVLNVIIALIMMAALLTGCRNDDSYVPSPADAGEPDNITTVEDINLEEVDYSEYFNGLEGTAVFFNAGERTYYIYNRELAELPTSPCSTFKIISGLMGLESGVIDASNSTRQWSGIHYPVAAWNNDLDFIQAFRDTAIWYFREVIDLMGEGYVQSILDNLNYGNRDISQWEGSLNNIMFPALRDSRELNGFWHESSLEISPMQLVDVLYRIFEERDIFSQDSLNVMKEAMYTENNDSSITIYGKTGSGITDEDWVNAWFAGMFEDNGNTTYFAIRINQPDARGAQSREVAINIINGEFVR